MSAPEFGEDGNCNCTEKDTKLKLHILLDDWPAVIDRTNNKDKTTDLEQAVESGRTLCNCFEYTASQNDRDFARRVANEDMTESAP